MSIRSRISEAANRDFHNAPTWARSCKKLDKRSMLWGIRRGRALRHLRRALDRRVDRLAVGLNPRIAAILRKDPRPVKLTP
jgi:hypothetical protein